MIYAKWIEADGRFAFSIDDNGGVELSEEERDALLLDESMGKVLAPDAGGRPVAFAAPPPSVEQLSEIERAWRDDELKNSDGVVARHRDQVESGVATTLDADQYKALQVYRQALRDWPAAESFPDAADRPSAPDWLATQIGK